MVGRQRPRRGRPKPRRQDGSSIVPSFLPPALAIRREVELTREAIAAADDEAKVRELVTAVNERIREVNRTVISGPPTTVMPMNVDDVVARWRAARS